MLSSLSTSEQNVSQDGVISNKPSASQKENKIDSLDSWWLSCGKVFVIYFILFFSLALSILALIGDFIALLFGFDFVLLKNIWSWSWSEMTMEWYWNKTTKLGSIFSVGLMVFGFIGAISDEFKPNKKINKD